MIGRCSARRPLCNLQMEASVSTARRQLSPQEITNPRFLLSDLPSLTYQSHFQRWDETSYIRKKPRRATPFAPDLYFFSESLATLFSHPKVRGVDEEVRRKLLVLHLYNYLEFTVWLELGPVNEICQ